MQADTLVWILGSTLLYGLAAAILHRVSPQRRLTPFLLLFDLGLLFFVMAVCLTMAGVTIFLAVPCWIVYVLMFLGCLALVSLDNVSIRLF